MRGAKGFTITELIVGLGLSMLVSIVTMTAMGMFTFQQKRSQAASTEYIDKTIAERVLLLDLRHADPSFNNMKGNIGGFFDYFPDVPATQIQNRERSLTLSLDKAADPGALNEVFFLVLDIKAGMKPMIIYDPIAAYAVGATPADFNVAATLTYMGIDNKRFLSDQEDVWVQNQFYMFDSPARFRPIGADPLAVPPRSPIFIGLASGGDLIANSTMSQRVNMGMPWSASSQAFASADSYLRNLPPIGGGQSVVRLKAVKLLRYYLEPMPGGQAGSRFLRQALAHTGFSPSFLIADKVKKVEFVRRDVTSREIVFGIEKVPQK